MTRSREIGAVRRFMVVVALADQGPNPRQTGKIDRATAQTRDAQSSIAEALKKAGVTPDLYVFDPPSSVGTFAAHTTDAVAKLIRGAPGVQAVLEA